MRPRYITPDEDPAIWDEVDFDVHGETRDEITRLADETLAKLAEGAEYRYELRITGMETYAPVPETWTGRVSGAIKRTTAQP